MADDLTSFIEQQKTKLDRERAELSRNGNYNVTSQTREDGRKASPVGYETVKRSQKSLLMANADKNDETGLQLGGYERHQQKLKEERRLEYNKFLAEKKLRSIGKVEPVLTEKDTSPVNNYKEENGRRSTDLYYDKKARDSFSPKNRRMGKENLDLNDNYYMDDRGHKPVQESYEQLLTRKRADERRYRVDFDRPDLDDKLSQMKLSSKNYQFNSRSDGILSHRDYDDNDNNEVGYSRRSRRRGKLVEPKRVRFHADDDDGDDDDIDNRYWSKPRRRLIKDYLDDDDDDNIDSTQDWNQRRSQRGVRRNSAHEERNVNHQPSQNMPIRRTQTDNAMRSQSAPLLDQGVGIIGGGHIETREMKLKRQEKYKNKLENQIKLSEDNKKKEKMDRFRPVEDAARTDSDPYQSPTIRHSTSRTSVPQGTRNQDGYDLSQGNYGPSSRPPQHSSLYPSPYNDPYFYYGKQERGAPQATALQNPLFKGSGYGVTGLYNDANAGPPQENYHQDRDRPEDFTQRSVAKGRTGKSHQPPGGYSNLSGIAGVGQGSPETDSAQAKKASQQAYQEELVKQMDLREKQKQKEKEAKEKYDRKKDEEIAHYDPWGRGGAGAPLRDVSGQVVANLRVMHQDNKDGNASGSPRYAPPPIEERFGQSNQPNYQSPQPTNDYQSHLSTDYQSTSQGQQANSAAVNSSPFGRSDPLKERQPHDDLKEKAKQEYQLFLKNQVEENERKKKAEQEVIRKEEEREEKLLQEQREKMQREYLQEQEKVKRKEQEAKRMNQELLEAQNTKKREAEYKRKEMEAQRQEELRKKLDDNITAKRTAETTTNFRTDSPPIPTMQKQSSDNIAAMNRGVSPPVPTLANKHKQDNSPPSSSSSSVPQRQLSAQGRQTRAEPDNDVLSQLTALRQQLKNEEQKVQQQIGRSTATNKYSQMGRIENESRRNKRDVSVFDRAMTNKPASTVRKADASDYSAVDEFSRIKHEDTSSLAGEFRSRFPQSATTDSMLDLQQQEFLREQDDKLSSLQAGVGKPKPHHGGIEGPSRSKSRDSLLDSESQFIAIDDSPAQIMPASQTDLRPRQSSARERRRWKQLEEMAKEQKPYDAFKPPTPGGFSLNSVTSFNVDEVANKNEERLKRLEAIRRVGGGGGKNDPDDVLKHFMSERGRPTTRASEASLEAETSYEPLNY